MHRAMRTKHACESAAAIRAKNRIWRVALRREAGEHENFFIAKTRDSESVLRAFCRHRLIGMTSIARPSLHARIAKTPAAQTLPAMSTFACIAFLRAPHIVARMHFDVADRRALRVLAQARQHFLKQDAVFLDVLVYSG
jgi:hypothetical protein